jgi:hypothetical protein
VDAARCWPMASATMCLSVNNGLRRRIVVRNALFVAEGQLGCCLALVARRCGPGWVVATVRRQSATLRATWGPGICTTAHTLDSRMDASSHWLTLTEPPGDREFSDDFVKV